MVNEDITRFDVLMYDRWLQRVQVVHSIGYVAKHVHPPCPAVAFHIFHEGFQTAVFEVIHNDRVTIWFVYDPDQPDNVG